jgi:cardiolipin synthase C
MHNGKLLKLFQASALGKSTRGRGDGSASHSAARLISNDLEALAIRLQVIGSAESTLDLQYYYWLRDMAGRLVAQAVITAADRGVKVRLLLDDLNANGLDRSFAALNEHPNISVRLFNPLRFRKNSFARLVSLIATYVTANRRMHNKCMVVDNKLAIVGGRNIGNSYFGIDGGTNFYDLDLLLSGTAAAETASVFDAYWVSKGSIQASRLIGRSTNKLKKLRKRMDEEAASPQALKLLGKIREEGYLVSRDTTQTVAHIEVAADPPEKAVMAETEHWLSPRIESLIASAQHEILILSPYFIPGRWGSELLEELAARGIKVQILTNCLAATDVVVAHSSYARYRRRLVSAGIKMFEQPAKIRHSRMRIFGSRKATLHTKCILVDRSKGFVGSFNFDPRSKSINTEMGVFFEDDRLGGSLAVELHEHLKHCFKVSQEGRELVWRSHAGRVVSRNAEPFASLRRRLISMIAGLFPIESQL